VKTLKKIRQWFKGAWSATSGFKTYTGIGLHVAWFVANLLYKDLASDAEVVTGHALIGTLTGVGIAHKIEKKVNNNINKASALKNK